MVHIKSRKHAPAGSQIMAMGAAMLLLGAHAAHAADAAAEAAVAEEIDGVDVTSAKGYRANLDSPKATASLLDTPQTINVITNELVRQQGAVTLTEALRNSAGVGAFSMGENGTTNTGDAVFLRGTDVSTSIFVDGVRDMGSISRDVFNIEQIEVLKGGAGADIGRGAATGSINIFSKQPIAKDIRDASISYGNGGGADFKRASADWGMPIADSAAVRLNLMWQDAGVPGRDRIKNNRWGVAPSIGFGLGGDTQVYLDYLHVKQDNTPDGGVSTIGLPGYSSPDPLRPSLSNAARVRSGNFYGTDDDHDNVEVDMATVIVDHRFNDGWSLHNISRWGENRQEYLLTSMNASGPTATNTKGNLLTPNLADPATWTIVRTPTNKSVHNKILDNQFTLKGAFATGGFTHSLAAGVEAIREEQHNGVYVATGAYPAVSVYNPVSAVSGYARTLSSTLYSEGTTDTLSAFAGDTMNISDSFLINGGVRVDRFNTEYVSFPATGANIHVKAKDDLWSYKAGAIWKPAPNASVYVSYALTQQPPGGANFTLVVSGAAGAGGVANVNNASVAPQKSKNYEAGVKWDALKDGKLSLTAAVYETKYSDQILQDTDGTFYRAGDKRIKGVELGAVGQITKDWNVTAGYSLMDTKVTSPTGTLVTADGTAVLAYTPKNAFNIWSTYRITDAFSVGGGANYNGALHRGSDGAVGTPKGTDSYWVFNGYAAYRINPTAELQFNVYNIFDKDYVASINKSGYRYTPGQARNARLTLNVTF